MIFPALSGDLNTAFAVLHQSGLTQDQKAKIALILKDPRSDMQLLIGAVVGEENIVSAAASSQATHAQRCVSFADVATSPFGNAYPCRFEFGGKHYQNATACFLAQQYTDQPEIMDFFTTLNPEAATALAELNPMTKERKISWENPHAEHIYKDDVLMHVLRAKFGQNPDLKKQLLETGTAYLVCQGYGFYLCDNMNGTGQNTLGSSLMRLRGEYGGAGQIAPPAAHQSAMQSLQTRSHLIANELYSDIIERLFYTCVSECDFITFTALACVNKHWSKCSIKFCVDRFNQLCPELRVLDAETQGVKCEDEPKISKLRLLKWAREISPHVEGNAGVTQLTMAKGTTLNQLIKIAKGEGMTIDVLIDRIIEEHGAVPVEQTYGILITNSVFMNSRNKEYNIQAMLVEEHGCVMPTVQEYVALCVYTNKVFKKCLFGRNQVTYGGSSTHVGNYPLVVGGSGIGRFSISDSHIALGCNGAGGQRKF
jgi:predicted NAD-dependent protein-ADP-ribosyltransferase YbiA (DUF1768 family)